MLGRSTCWRDHPSTVEIQEEPAPPTARIDDRQTRDSLIAHSLVIDLDVQGNATEHLIGTDDPLRPADDGGRAIYRTIMDGDQLQVVPVRPGLDLVPAGPRTQSLADELNRVAGNRTEVIASSFSGLRHAIHTATAGYDIVVIDTPPSEQSHGLLDCMMVVADAVVIPTKISKDDITGAVKLLQRLAALDRLGVDYARPLGAVLVSAPTGASRIEARAEADLALITRHIPLFNSRIRYRPAPISEASRRHQTLQQIYSSLPTDAERLRGLRTRPTNAEHLTLASAAKAVQEHADLFDEIVARFTQDAAA